MRDAQRKRETDARYYRAHREEILKHRRLDRVINRDRVRRVERACRKRRGYN